MTVQDDKSTITSPVEDKNRPDSMGRRALLRGGITAMPAILTLHSGAALARSSNLISASSPDTTDDAGRTLCINRSSVVYADADGNSEVFDLDEPPYAEVNIIRSPTKRQYYASDNKSTPVHPGAMCEQGGQYWWKPENGKFEPVQVPQGFVASSGAFASIAGYVKDNLI